MRHERDRYRERFDQMKEDMQEIKRQRDQLQQRSDRTNQIDGRASPANRRYDDFTNKRPTSGTLHRDSRSPDGVSRRDGRYSVTDTLNVVDVCPLDLSLPIVHHIGIGQGLYELTWRSCEQILCLVMMIIVWKDFEENMQQRLFNVVGDSMIENGNPHLIRLVTCLSLSNAFGSLVHLARSYGFSIWKTKIRFENRSVWKSTKLSECFK